MSTTLNNIQVNGTSYNIRNIYYGELTSTASTAAKVATTSTSEDFSLAAGNTIVLSCGTGHGNTADGAITLNVDGTGAKSIYYHGAATSTTNPFAWSEDSVLTFVYDGTNFIFIAMDKGGSSGSTGSGIIVQDENGNLVVSDIEGGVAYTEGAGIDIINGVISAEVTPEDIPPTMTILSYGTSTWADFIAAYETNTIVYCRASSNSDPASGSQTRMAFMAYVNNATNPTEVEFQYYRSVSSHTDSQQGDQVFVYKLNKTNGWSVLTRNAFSKIVAGTGLDSSYSNGVLTLNTTGTIPTKTSDLTNDSNFVVDANYVHTDSNYTSTEKTKLSGIATGAEVNVQANWTETSSTSDAYIQNKPTIPTKTSDLTNDSNFITDASYVHTDNNYTSTEKSKLSGIASGAEVNVQANWNETTTTSDAYIKNKPSLATVATSGSYTDLSNKPTIPTATSDLTNDSNFIAEDTNGDITITRNINASGDISTDGRVILDDNIYNVLTTSSPTSAPSQDKFQPFGRVTHDLATTEEVHLAEFGSVMRATGESQIYLQAANAQDGTRKLNMLLLGVDANGDATVTLHQTAWRNALGLATTDWAYLQGSASSTDKYVRWRAKSGIVFVQWHFSTDSGHSGSSLTIGTIPSGYRPDKTVDGVCYGTGNNVLWYEIQTGGAIRVGSKGSGSSASLYGSASYPL